MLVGSQLVPPMRSMSSANLKLEMGLLPMETAFFKVNEVVEELTLVLHVILNDDSAAEDLFHCVPFNSESSLLFGQQFLGFFFKRLRMMHTKTLLGCC
ncbi:hypothetical protein DPMN_064394 [Dreissena polymorpha]|uniref:Uncharacterized protein n=1 Tax=Dreissena polymorpha TaxID=45954 RepID=A0A9D4CC67_DREPO|nr:hypothetical protein DPMN_064394 [Dreissena polymorpha]